MDVQILVSVFLTPKLLPGAIINEMLIGRFINSGPIFHMLHRRGINGTLTAWKNTAGNELALDSF